MENVVDIDKKYVYMSLNSGRKGVVWFDRKSRTVKSDPEWIIEVFRDNLRGTVSPEEGVPFFRRMVAYNNGYSYFTQNNSQDNE